MYESMHVYVHMDMHVCGCVCRPEIIFSLFFKDSLSLSLF